VLKLIFEIGNGLKTLHDEGIIHRDIKPANIFLTTDETFKLGIILLLFVFIIYLGDYGTTRIASLDKMKMSEVGTMFAV
jgi:serine/threonine protein kinase